METTHTLVTVGESEDEALFHCLSCSRKIVLGKGTPKKVVIDPGDETAVHLGALPGLAGRTGGDMEMLTVGIVP